MPRPEHFTAREVRSGVEQTLGTRRVSDPQRTEHGFGNENWRIVVDGRDLLVKITPAEGHPVDKLVAAAAASRMAERAGVPVPREVFFSAHCDVFAGAITRIQEYLPGHHPNEVLRSREAVTTFFASLADAVALLHSIKCDAFASRVGGQPQFPTWQQYLAYRVPQIVARSRAVSAYDEQYLQATVESLLAAAAEVSAKVEPRLCHRDLSLDNVVVDEHGKVVALLDFDLAEPWDCAVDMVKLTWATFPRFPAAEQIYRQRYFHGATEPDQWDQRLWVTNVLELLNSVPYAMSAQDPRLEQSARRRLAEVLSGRP